MYICSAQILKERNNEQWQITSVDVARDAASTMVAFNVSHANLVEPMAQASSRSVQ
jgi:hypothetical protein